jgi:hypothetical protein
MKFITASCFSSKPKLYDVRWVKELNSYLVRLGKIDDTLSMGNAKMKSKKEADQPGRSEK